jgi:MoaA/NifB/PqqE/SkfB family radical SAM enzyme
MEAAKEKAKLINGINTEQLFSTIDLIKENPDIFNFFRLIATTR